MDLFTVIDVAISSLAVVVIGGWLWRDVRRELRQRTGERE